MAKDGSGRTRNFATVVYPESAPDNWISILEELKIPCFISPLHDSDTTDQGEIKKPHYHVLFMFDSVKTTAQAQEVIDQIAGVGMEKVSSLRAYARYLCHLDSPDKVKYDIGNVLALSGADYLDVISLPVDKYTAIQEMMDFCDERNIISYGALLRYARRERNDWFRSLCDNSSFVMKEFIKTRLWENDYLDEDQKEI